MKLSLYTISTLACYYVMKDSDNLHWALGGKNSYLNLYENYPCQKYPPLYYEMYLAKFAFYCYELYETIVYLRQRHDFYEMIVHHIATFILVYSTFSCGFMTYGGPVMLLHSITDIFVQMFKLCFDFIGIRGKALMYPLFVGSWIYCRIIVFPFIYISHVYYESLPFQDVPGIYPVTTNVVIYFFILEVLHCYWLFLMFKGLYMYFAG